ncbi:MAG: glycosyltransferase, partial [Proteobacteria bacterium]|nr:glycosyltransferase [Pseudomonadota bacterium]
MQSKPPGKRILCVTSNFPRWEGDSTTPFVLHLAEDLQDLGWKVDVLAPHAPSAASQEVLAGVNVKRFRYLWPASLETVCYQGGALMNLQQNRSNYIKLPALVFFEWFAIVRRLLWGNYDLLHSHWILPQGFTGVLAAKLFRLPHVITVHGSDAFALQGKVLGRFKRFSLSGADAALFQIVGTELRLIAGASLDFETNPSLDVTVEVDDTTVGATPDDTAPLSISITDVNEPPTVALANTITTFPEDQDTSVAIKVADIVITDDVLGTNNLTLSGADAALFEIVGTELRLIAGVTLDFATNPSLDVTVVVDDTAVGAAPDDTAPLSISITDVNADPMAVGESVTISEDTVYTTVAGVNDLLMNDSDPDGDLLTLDVVPVAGPTQGSVTLNVDGTFTYVPDPNVNGSDAFT